MANWTELLGFDPRTGSGWIPPAERTVEQAKLHERVMGATPAFGDIVSVGDLPEAALFVFLELKHTGGLLFRIHQRTGSCVVRVCGAKRRRDTVGVSVGKRSATFGRMGCGRDSNATTR